MPALPAGLIFYPFIRVGNHPDVSVLVCPSGGAVPAPRPARALERFLKNLVKSRRVFIFLRISRHIDGLDSQVFPSGPSLIGIGLFIA